MKAPLSPVSQRPEGESTRDQSPALKLPSGASRAAPYLPFPRQGQAFNGASCPSVETAHPSEPHRETFILLMSLDDARSPGPRPPRTFAHQLCKLCLSFKIPGSGLVSQGLHCAYRVGILGGLSLQGQHQVLTTYFFSKTKKHTFINTWCPMYPEALEHSSQHALVLRVF